MNEVYFDLFNASMRLASKTMSSTSFCRLASMPSVQVAATELLKPARSYRLAQRAAILADTAPGSVQGSELSDL
jgi:hypothetical protein